MKIIFYYFISAYVLVKDLLGIPKGALKKRFFLVSLSLQICLFALTIITILLTLLTVVPLQTFLWSMDLYLMWKLGGNYGGRLKGQDAELDSPDEKVSISVLLILNHNEDMEAVSKRLHALAAKLHNSFYKLSCSVEKLLGYAYYVKNQVPTEGCCISTKINNEEYLTKEAFLEYIQKKQMVRIINDKRLWYGNVFTQPILWNKKSATNKQIAVLVIFRHCLADGVSLIGLLKNFIIREENPELMKLDPKYTTTPNFSFDDAYLYRNPLTAKKDEHIFDIPHGERQFAFYVEDDIKYVPLVKKIKNKIGVGFTEILVAGLTASLAEFLSKRGKTMDACSMGILYRPINSDLVSIINGTYDYDNLTNDSTILIIKCLVTMKEGSTMRDRINAINDELTKAKYSIDGLAYYAVGNLGHLLPAPILNWCMHFVTHVTGGATNVGGLRTGTIAGCEVETALSFIPYYYIAGFRLSIFSKGDRFQLALTTRENILNSMNEAQLILTNTFKYISQLNEELENEK